MLPVSFGVSALWLRLPQRLSAPATGCNRSYAAVLAWTNIPYVMCCVLHIVTDDFIVVRIR